MKTRYPNVTVAPDRHGKLRARFRKTGRKPVYLKTLPDQPGFDAEYRALQDDAPAIQSPTVIPRSVNDLLLRYYRSGDFAGKGGDQHRHNRRLILESFAADYGNDLVVNFTFEHIEAILLLRMEKRKNAKGRWVGGPVAVANLREELLRLFRYAKKLKWRSDNPVEDAEVTGKKRLTGFYSWTEADIAQYQARHPVGTTARLALEIFLWTGQRRGDASTFGRRHIVRGKINFRAGKNDADLWLPMAPDLRRAIDAMPVVGTDVFLLNAHGKPFSVAGLGNKMRQWCDQAGLPRCTAHGLRKAIARRAAQAEATQQGIKSLGGWKNDSEVTTYVAAVEQETLADAAMARVIDRFGSDLSNQPTPDLSNQAQRPE